MRIVAVRRGAARVHVLRVRSMAAKKSASSCGVDDALARLTKRAQSRVRDGVALPDIHAIAKALGRDHELALELWATGIYEARLLACLVGEPARVTVRQMDAWCRTFDTRAVCDSACVPVFDRSPLAWGRLLPWSKRTEELQKRAEWSAGPRL